MKALDTSPRLAVFIDAENVGHTSYINLVCDKIASANLGTPVMKRAYGNFGQRPLDWTGPWTEKCRELGIEIVQQEHYVKGKGSADVRIVVDAMRLWLRRRKNRIGAFCFVSSDTDFRPLVDVLVAGNRKVYGFGREGTPPALRDAYPDGFFSFERLRCETAEVRAIREILRRRGDWMPVTELLRELRGRIEIPHGFFLLPLLRSMPSVFEVESGPKQSYVDSRVQLLDARVALVANCKTPQS